MEGLAAVSIGDALIGQPDPLSKVGTNRTGRAERIALVPYDPREAVPLPLAAKIACKSEATMRDYCARYMIGRKVAGGNWQISVVALAAVLDDNANALDAYLLGDRNSGLVAHYFSALGGKTFHPIICHEAVLRHRDRQAKR